MANPMINFPIYLVKTFQYQFIAGFFHNIHCYADDKHPQNLVRHNNRHMNELATKDCIFFGISAEKTTNIHSCISVYETREKRCTIWSFQEQNNVSNLSNLDVSNISNNVSNISSDLDA